MRRCSEWVRCLRVAGPLALCGVGLLGFVSPDAGAAPIEPIVAPSRTAAEWYAMGGAAMHGLTLCSVLGLTAIAERLWVLRRNATLPRTLVKALDEAMRTGQFVELKPLCEKPRSALARLLETLLRPDATIDLVEAQGGLEVHRLQRNLPLLQAVGNLATMIGLFGTVLGMIEAFDVIAVSGTGDARIVAGGIFRALVTTAGGLGVGITALAAHAILARMADDRSAALESISSELFSRLPASGNASHSHYRVVGLSDDTSAEV